MTTASLIRRIRNATKNAGVATDDLDLYGGLSDKRLVSVCPNTYNDFRIPRRQRAARYAEIIDAVRASLPAGYELTLQGNSYWVSIA